MKILYSLPHPSDRLGEQRAGHIIRATSLLDSLEKLGHQVIRLEAASKQDTALRVSFYRKIIRKFIPQALAFRLRDKARIQHGQTYSKRLISAALDHHPDIILETHIAFSLAGKIASSKTGIPLVLDDCSPSWEEKQQYGVGLENSAVKIHQEVTRCASLITAVNETMRQYLIDEGVPEEKIVTIYNGFDGDLFNENVSGDVFRKSHNIPSNVTTIVFVGSFQPYHKVDLLIKAFAQLEPDNKFHLILAGDGQGLESAKKLTSDIGLSNRVTFTGKLLYADVPQCLAAGDIAVMPATNTYGNPMKIYEYMAIGKAVVAPDQPTITEIAKHGVNAALFEPENVTALHQVLTSLVLDENYCRKIGQQGARDMLGHTWDNRAKLLSDSIKKMLLKEKE
jgi:glycosyltransferase involved in cell wall biosynthesis